MTKFIGVGIPHQMAEKNPDYYKAMLFLLTPPYWHNWLFDQRTYIWPPYYPTVWAPKQDVHSEQAVPLSKYGIRLWHLGTEPNNREQANTDAKTAAAFTRWWVANSAGPIALPGVIVMDPDSMDAIGWMTTYLNNGGVVPDFWTVSNYAWVPDQWDNNLKPFVSLITKCKIVRPIIIKECAAYGTDLTAQIKMMDHIHKRLNDGTIHEAFWYSTHDPFGPFRAADLTGKLGKILPLGEHYLSLKIETNTPIQTVHLPIVMG